MPELLRSLVSSDGFMPHGHCYLWNPSLVWLHVISDALVALSYTSISCTLIYFARKRRGIPFHWMFLCFGTFIVACGATHAMEIWTLWTPLYWLSGAIKAITAAASVPTAILLVLLVPKALALPTSEQLQRAHDDLAHAHAVLEARVMDRTAELTQKNEELSRQIVERKRAEDALRESEARFRRLADAGIIGVLVGDFRGTILDANDALLAMVGYTREEVLSGRVRWPEVTPPEWRHLDQRALQQLEETGIAPSWEKEYVRKDGTRVPVLMGVAMLEGTAGECIAFILDLTERKRAERALRESEARKTAVMEAALDAIVMMNHEGSITEWNPAAENTFGYTRSEALGTRLSELLLSLPLQSQHTTELERYLDMGDAPSSGRRIEVPLRRRDGSQFPAEVVVVRIMSEGAPLFVGYIRDITERRQAAEAEVLRAAKEAAEEANAELEAFSYSVAHDLRTPLRAISGFSSALREDWGDRFDEEAKENLASIVAGAHRMGQLIDALLGLARLTRTEPRRAAVDMTQLARATIEQLRATDPSRAVDFVVTDGLVAQGDAQLLRILLENLLGNAWKFTSKKRDARIEFGREEPGSVTDYFVRDNGAGFDMTHVSKLFAPFRRLHSGDEYEGTGIGLATVQRIVRRHGGRVWAEGAEDRGATFRFTLAASEAMGTNNDA
jgi:PAS domain S-box-containing protein